MKVSIVTDEISADLDTALELARTWGVDGIEFRGAGNGRYPRVAPFQRDLAPRLIRESGLEVVALSPGLFKFPFPSDDRPVSFYQWSDSARFSGHSASMELLEDHLERLLPESIEAALELDCRTIKIFGFTRADALMYEVLGLPHTMPVGILDVMKEAASVAEASGVTLCVENEMRCWTSTSTVTSNLVSQVASPALGIAWDPANAYIAGETTDLAEATARLAPLVKVVDFKDVRTDPDSGRRVFAVEGDIDWAAQLKTLKESGYDGYITVETHMRPKVASSEALIRRLRGLIESI